mgnify:CR=1 FL=1
MQSDLRFAIRQWFKDPGFAAINVLTLALGIGVNLVIFGIYSALYLRPFPFEESTRLLDLNETAPRWNLEYTGLAYPDFCGWREHNRSFEGMAVWNHAGYNLSFQGDAQRIRGVRVSHDLASVLRISPALGRFFRADEDQPGGDRVVVLANGFWQRQFGGNRAVIGQTLRLDHEPYTIVGVLPPGETVLVEGDLWVPLALDPNVRTGWFLNGVGRLRPGVTPAAARADLARVHAGLVEHGGADANTSPKLTPLRDRYFGSPRLMIQMLLGAVVNETFARRYWPNSDPIGQRIRHRGNHTPWMTVVGVVRDVKHYGLDQPMIPGVYLPYPQDPQSQMAIVLRSALPPSELVPSVRSLLRESDPDLALANVMPMAERLSQSMWARRLVAWLFAIFSGVALSLAVGGIYGVFSFTVNRRRQELGVRLALGAQRPDLLWLVVRQGLRLTVIGSGIGLVVVLATAPLTRHALFGVSPLDPPTYLAITLGLILVVLLACWFPARRAANADPMLALRCE